MHWLEQHKAIIITFLISGLLILGGFSVHVTTNSYISETFYDIEPTAEITQKTITEGENQKLPKSNKTHNEDEAFKQMMRNFKTVKALNAEQPEPKQTEPSNTNIESSIRGTQINNKTYAINSEERTKYKTLKAQLNNSLKNKASSESNIKSAIGFTLKGRQLVNEIPTPRYLCEYGGTISITIAVNAAGYVNKATVNTVSTTNECLKNYAITHAKKARFNTSDLKTQIGTITFIFEGKRK